MDNYCKFIKSYCTYVQVDYLQQANRDLEKRLKDALNEQIDARRRANDFEEKNLELLSELKDIDRMSKKVEESKERDVNMVKRDLVDARVSCCQFLNLNIWWHHIQFD